MYALGIDLGTTFSAAAVWRDDRVEICALGSRSAAIPSIIVVRADGSVLTGDAAARRAVAEPDRVAREFKRRMGDSTPLLLGGSPFSAEALTARLLSSLVQAVVDREGGKPASVVVSHPANWGPFKTELLRDAVHLADLGVPVSYTTEPEAAAISYARQERLAPGETIAVYDLGGGTFDAAVLRRTETGFSILGQPEGIERLGGIDIDAAVFGHVVRSIGAPLTDLDEDDPATIAAVARLRADCTEAKEALSSDTDTTIPVLLPNFSSEVRLTRAELEAMVRPPLYDSIQALQRALRSAGVTADELSAVLLVGGSSRMPLVAQLVGAELGRPVAVDAHPKHAIALGAAWLASGTAAPAQPAPATRLVTVQRDPAPQTVAVAASPPPVPPAPVRPQVPPASSPAARVQQPATDPNGLGVASRPPMRPQDRPLGTPQNRPATGPQSRAGSAPQNRPGAGYPQSAPGTYPQAPPVGYRPTPPPGQTPGRSGPTPAGYGQAGYPQPGPAPMAYAHPLPRSVAGQVAPPRKDRARWLLPVVAATVMLLLVVAFAVWQMTRANGDDGPAGATGAVTVSPGAAPAAPEGVEDTGTASGKPPAKAARTSSAAADVPAAARTSATTRPSSPSGSTARTTASALPAGSTPPTTQDRTTTSSSTRTSTTTTSTTSDTGPKAPGAVTSVRLSDPAQTTLVVDWGLAPGATRYQLSWVESGADGRTWDGVPPDYTDYRNGPVTLTNLRPGRTYTVTVTPFNGQIAGPRRSATGQTLA